MIKLKVVRLCRKYALMFYGALYVIGFVVLLVLCFGNINVINGFIKKSLHTNSQDKRNIKSVYTSTIKFEDQNIHMEKRFIKESTSVFSNKNYQTKKIKIPKGGYADETKIEDINIPVNWTASKSLTSRFTARKEQVYRVCEKYSLNIATGNIAPYAWEYIYNTEYNIAWCPIFKSASSSWMFNFNILAGYSQEQLYRTKDTPIALARKKYPRFQAAQEFFDVLNIKNPFTFIIVRNPIERLISAYRDKMETYQGPYFDSLYKQILLSYPHLREHKNKTVLKNKTPNFNQFVQFVIDSLRKEEKNINEHWQSINKFCTPCFFDIDIFAKVETLDEDENYIIFTAGIQNVIKPKKVNISKKGPTADYLSEYLCMLSEEQINGLREAYIIDMEMFDYSMPNFTCQSM